MKNVNRPKLIAKVIASILILGGFAYLGSISIKEYQAQNEAMGIVICDGVECIKTMHVHSDIEFDLCGESPVLPRETGPLAGLHTHKEKNYLHFHDQVDLDLETREQLFDQRLSIQEVIDIFELKPEKYCEEPDVQIEVIVNDSPSTLDYNWTDGDQIKLIYRKK